MDYKPRGWEMEVVRELHEFESSANLREFKRIVSAYICGFLLQTPNSKLFPVPQSLNFPKKAGRFKQR